MIPLIENNRERIADLCRRYAVKELELFGSAAAGDFVAGKSDVDFFVEFLDYENKAVADNWFGLQESLEDLFGCKVDLVSPRTATNPYFLKLANEHRVRLYAA